MAKDNNNKQAAEDAKRIREERAQAKQRNREAAARRLQKYNDRNSKK